MSVREKLGLVTTVVRGLLSLYSYIICRFVVGIMMGQKEKNIYNKG